MLQVCYFLANFATPFTFYPCVQTTNEKIMAKIPPKFNSFKTNENKQVQKQPVVSNSTKKALLKGSQSPLSALSKDKVNFTGLNRNLSKMAYKYAKSIKAEVAIFPNSKGIVGNLPAEWVQKIPKENRADAIKEFYSDLNTIVKSRRMNVFANKETAQNISAALSKAGIIQDGQKLKIDYIDEGGYGSAFRLKGLSDDKYIIKVFNANNPINDYHGKYTEQSRAAFWQKYAGKNTQMVPFYFGDTDAGYMVNKFIDESVTKPQKYIIPESLGLNSDDIDEGVETGRNIINGFQIDYGGMKIANNNLVKHKGKQVNFRKFLALPPEEQLASLNKADDAIKLHAIAKIGSRPLNERTAYFQQLMNEPSEQVRLKLPDKLYTLLEEERVPHFEQLATNASDGVKNKLAYIFDCLPEKNRAACFKLLGKDSSNNVKINLVQAILFIPKAQKAECCKVMIENANPAVKNKLNQFLGYIPEEEGKALKKLLRDPNEPGLFASILGKFFPPPP
jgi:hypothetical protein